MEKNRRIKHIHFDSVSEVGAYCAKYKPVHKATRLHGVEFTGFMSYDEACTRAVFGDDGLAEKARAILAKFDDSLPANAWVDVPSVMGAYPVVPEALNGEPECMRMPEQTFVEGAPLHVVIELCSSVRVTADQMMARGVAVLALVLRLVAVRPVTLQFVACLDGGSPRKAKSQTNTGFPGMASNDDYSIVTIDVPTAPMDLATTAFAMAHAAFTRQLIFGIATTEHQFVFSWGMLKGERNPLTTQYKENLRELLGITDEFLFIPMAMEDSMAVLDPMKYLERLYAAYSGQQQALAY